jgi:hypothetical protein
MGEVLWILGSAGVALTKTARSGAPDAAYNHCPSARQRDDGASGVAAGPDVKRCRCHGVIFSISYEAKNLFQRLRCRSGYYAAVVVWAANVDF